MDFTSNNIFRFFAIIFLAFISCSDPLGIEENVEALDRLIISDKEWLVYDMSNSGIPADMVYDVAVDAQNTVWIATSQGLTRYDRKSWRTINSSNSNMPVDKVFHIRFDKRGRLWLITNAGLLKKNGNSFDIICAENSPLPTDSLSDLAFTDRGDFWVCPDRGGVFKFDGKNWESFSETETGLIEIKYPNVAVDSSQNIWIGTDDTGAAMYDGNDWSLYHVANFSLKDESVREIEVDREGIVWVATWYYLSRFDGSNWSHIGWEILPFNFINDIYIDDDNVKWVCGENATPRQPGDSSGFIRIYNDSIQSFCLANTGLPSDRCFAIAKDKFGNMIIATKKGLVFYRKDGVVLGKRSI